MGVPITMKTANCKENRRLLNLRCVFVFMCVNMVEGGRSMWLDEGRSMDT